MKIITLIENESDNKDLESEHGLSLYIETVGHKILFDAGSSPLFSVNAGKMGVELEAVDVAFLSHGHYDHGGGLETFLKLNAFAKIYVQENVFAKHYSHSDDRPNKYIGLEPSLSTNPRFVRVQGNHRIDERLAVFSKVDGRRLLPSGNQEMYMEIDGKFMRDDFHHEQNLIIGENDKTVLLAGCAHRGIVNIVDQFINDYGKAPDVVIGGFHLHSRASGKSEPAAVVADIGKALAETKSNYYTGHCTGRPSYNILKEIMDDKLAYLSTGMTIEI